MLYYSGIGSRETPLDFLRLFTSVASYLSDQGFTLRSGGADGADLAFERGASPAYVEIYLPWKGFNNKQYFIKGHAEEGKTIKPTRKKMRRKGGLHPITLEEAIELLQDDCERDNVMFRCVKRGRVMFLRVTDLKWVFDDSQDTENFLGADFYWEETVDGEER